jgi:hypothetical protein
VVGTRRRAELLYSGGLLFSSQKQQAQSRYMIQTYGMAIARMHGNKSLATVFFLYKGSGFNKVITLTQDQNILQGQQCFGPSSFWCDPDSKKKRDAISGRNELRERYIQYELASYKVKLLHDNTIFPVDPR